MNDLALAVSTSGGKDSTATLLLALERFPKDKIFPVFADTGNEHDLVYEYLDYLEKKLDIKIVRLKRDFTEEWWHRRDYVRDSWVEKMVAGRPESRKMVKGIEVITEAIAPIPRPESEKITARVLAFMEKGPTGNPFLDLCIIKGRFPSSKAPFCSIELKQVPLRDYTYDLCRQFKAVESWQGVRADESPKRALLEERESDAGIYEIYRPILKWNVAQVFELHRKHGVDPNPLYKLGMGRVGCMPCINARKAEILQISKRFNSHIVRISEWEKLVAEGSRRQQSTFFPHPEIAKNPELRPTVWDDVEWSKTERGGKQYSFESQEEPEACSSRYGLCGTWEESAILK